MKSIHKTSIILRRTYNALGLVALGSAATFPILALWQSLEVVPLLAASILCLFGSGGYFFAALSANDLIMGNFVRDPFWMKGMLSDIDGILRIFELREYALFVSSVIIGLAVLYLLKPTTLNAILLTIFSGLLITCPYTLVLGSFVHWLYSNTF